MLRQLMYFCGYYRWQFKKKYAPNTRVGNIRFSIQRPDNIDIDAKLIGNARPGIEAVSIQQWGEATIRLLHNVVLRKGVSLSAYGSGTISLGENTTVGKRSSFETYGKSGIFVGRDCRISWDCLFLCSDQHMIQHNGADLPFEEDIKIGNHVWIGARSTILKGTKLGDNCIVAAGTVCSGKYPSGTLIAGVPGRVIKKNINWRNLMDNERKGVRSMER